MKTINIAILGPSEIAYRRLLPAVKKTDSFNYYCVAVANKSERELYAVNEVKEDEILFSKSKAVKFYNEFGGRIINSYMEVIENDEIDSVYIPLPPALHYYWCQMALKAGKHVLLEKPFTLSLMKTMDLIETAKSKNLALLENYSFVYHKQFKVIDDVIKQGEIGDLRQIRTSFGFPFRGSNDFRYNKKLGGGALYDCGGYPIKLSSELLGDSARIMAGNLECLEYDVDIFGSATMTNGKITSQVSFGMDNYYKCEVEVWGNKGVLMAPRVFTAPADFSAEIIVKNVKENIIKIPMDDQFLNAVNEFHLSISDYSSRINNYIKIETQAKHIDRVIKMSSKEGDATNYE